MPQTQARSDLEGLTCLWVCTSSTTYLSVVVIPVDRVDRRYLSIVSESVWLNDLIIVASLQWQHRSDSVTSLRRNPTGLAISGTTVYISRDDNILAELVLQITYQTYLTYDTSFLITTPTQLRVTRTRIFWYHRQHIDGFTKPLFSRRIISGKW